MPDDFDERWNGATFGQDSWHFHRALLERYGIVLKPGEFSDLVKALRAGELIKVRDHSRGRAIYAHRLPTSLRTIYILAANGRVFTAWPPNRPIKETHILARSKSAK